MRVVSETQGAMPTLESETNWPIEYGWPTRGCVGMAPCEPLAAKTMTPNDAMCRIDTLLSHVWMVRAFLKHAPESEDDEELCEVHRGLYDYMLALGGPWKERNAADYLKLAHKKYSKLRQAAADFAAMQPEVSTHTNFQMAAQSLTAAVQEIGDVLAALKS